MELPFARIANVIGPWKRCGMMILAGVLFLNTGMAAESVNDRIQRVETGLRPAIVIEGQPEETFGITERMAFYKTPGVSVAVINNGVIEWARGYGVRESGTMDRVTPDTIFQAASISKPVGAMVALRLVEEGTLALDADVNRQLVSWKLPENEFTKEKKVTLRLLLSHRAGLVDHAGFSPALPDEPTPTLRAILESGQWTPAPVRVGLEPGNQFRYSGGGYCLMEQLLEDVSGKSFPVLARELVLEPLGMTSSWFEQPLPEQYVPIAATGHLGNGEPLPQKWNVYPATSAAGLWTTPTDLARFAIEVQDARGGRSERILGQRMATDMLSAQGRRSEQEARRIQAMEAFPDNLALARGLGVGLIGEQPTRFFHTGSNPGYQCELHAYIHEGKGAIVMTNANQGWRLGREILWSIAREYDWQEYGYDPEVKKVAQLSPDEFSQYIGDYRNHSSKTALTRRPTGGGGRTNRPRICRATCNAFGEK